MNKRVILDWILAVIVGMMFTYAFSVIYTNQAKSEGSEFEFHSSFQASIYSAVFVALIGVAMTAYQTKQYKKDGFKAIEGSIFLVVTGTALGVLSSIALLFV